MSDNRRRNDGGEHQYTIFDAVAKNDLEGIIVEYIKNARTMIVSYLSLRKRWSSKLSEQKQEEKLDEYLQHLAGESARLSRLDIDAETCGPAHYQKMLNEASLLLSRDMLDCGDNFHKIDREFCTISEEGDRLIWQSINVLSNSRPSPSFVVYNKSGEAEEGEGQPIFDGSVANATPPPLGPPGARPSAGSGTLLHLACVTDSPFALALLLALGADPRSPHTAFRRLMIHEAACSGSLRCLTLLLELGKECALQLYTENQLDMPKNHEKKSFLNNESKKVGKLPTRKQRRPLPTIPMLLGEANPLFGLPEKPKVPNTKSWIEKLKHFFDLACQVRKGEISELDAARTVLAYDTISLASRKIIAQSCSFLVKDSTMSGNPFKCPWYADGHGNTPLHWAAFKNECPCVSILLKYHADPNAHAHPSGWTALHDAAYSNSAEAVELLLDAGANVDIKANSGATPLCFAAQEDADGAARLLLSRGADLSIRCAGGPRSTAAEGGGNSLSHPNGRFSGYTPLHYCAHYNAHRAARVLLSHPSSQHGMEISDLSDRLPIHVAVARGSSDVLRELLHAGARVETRVTSTLSPRRVHSVSGLRTETLRALQDMPMTPIQSINDSISSEDGPSTPVSSPVLRSMIPVRPITSSKPWNCLTQRSIDECRSLISQAEQNWAPDRHLLFTPADRRAVFELLRVGKRLEQMDTGIFLDLWPLVLSFCGRGWFETKDNDEEMEDSIMPYDLALPALNDMQIEGKI